MARMNPLPNKFVKVWQTKAYNPSDALVVKFRGKLHRLVLAAGERDDVHAWRQGQFVYVVSYNTGMEYCGLQRFDLTDTTVKLRRFRDNEEVECIEGEDIVFMQQESDIKESFPKGLGNYSAPYIRKVLQQWEE